MSANMIFGSGVIEVGLTPSPTDAVECQVSNFVVTANANTVAVPGTYCQGPSSAGQKSSWSLELSAISDFGSTPSLAELLFDNDGTILFFEFTPDDLDVPDATGSFYAVAAPFGGEGAGLWQYTLTLQMPEQPVLTPKT